MLIDLARNDIGRIAQTGSVKVTDAFCVERYSHVMHIVSNVEGLLNPGMRNMDVLRATFPAGTLTGAPKVHAMELIDQLERRGALEPVLAAESRRYAYVEHLKRKALDSRSLAECWQKIPAQHKRDPRIAATAARCMVAVNASAQAQQVIETALEVGWDADLVTQYGLCDSGDALGQIELAERWLPGHPRDAALLLALGKLCARQRLWGKAQSYLEESLSVERSCATHRALAELQDQLGNTEAALRHYRQSLELALADLKAVGVKRRS